MGDLAVMDHAPDVADQGVIAGGDFGQAGNQAGSGHGGSGWHGLRSRSTFARLLAQARSVRLLSHVYWTCSRATRVEGSPSFAHGQHRGPSGDAVLGLEGIV